VAKEAEGVTQQRRRVKTTRRASTYLNFYRARAALRCLHRTAPAQRAAHWVPSRTARAQSDAAESTEQQRARCYNIAASASAAARCAPRCLLSGWTPSHRTLQHGALGAPPSVYRAA